MKSVFNYTQVLFGAQILESHKTEEKCSAQTGFCLTSKLAVLFSSPAYHTTTTEQGG